ncbi:MAG: hypothetical protein HY884_04685 [Deltaproteobacteria bacterium]|nr:hypothetical protein [Deltaproteobacteria bacterium]
MSDDVLVRLKAKEEEIEAAINIAKMQAASIKEGALKKAREVKLSSLKRLDEDARALAAMQGEELKNLSAKMDAEAGSKAAELRKIGLKNMDEAVETVLRRVMEALSDKGDA